LAPIPQKFIHACVECGCVFSIKANVQDSQCPVCNSESFEKIEGFEYE
jgi:predicted Zn-ribbon and HTH transcriptional regulator